MFCWKSWHHQHAVVEVLFTTKKQQKTYLHTDKISANRSVRIKLREAGCLVPFFWINFNAVKNFDPFDLTAKSCGVLTLHSCLQTSTLLLPSILYTVKVHKPVNSSQTINHLNCTDISPIAGCRIFFFFTFQPKDCNKTALKAELSWL